jgi:hypothetical protein
VHAPERQREDARGGEVFEAVAETLEVEQRGVSDSGAAQPLVDLGGASLERVPDARALVDDDGHELRRQKHEQADDDQAHDDGADDARDPPRRQLAHDRAQGGRQHHADDRRNHEPTELGQHDQSQDRQQGDAQQPPAGAADARQTLVGAQGGRVDPGRG